MENQEIRLNVTQETYLNVVPPRVEFYGGDGEGAAGNVILGNFIENFVEEIQDVEGINEELGGIIGISEPIPGDKVLKEVSFFTGSIIGVDITYPGRGYTEEPIVGFVDNCDQGYGAFGRAKIDKDPNSPTFGQVTGVVITSPVKIILLETKMMYLLRKLKCKRVV